MNDQILKPKRFRRRRIAVISTVFFLLVLGGFGHRYVRAACARLTMSFERLGGELDIRFRKGQEVRAKTVAGFLDESIRTIEEAYAIELKPFPVICLATENEFAMFTVAPGSRGCCTILREVCLSPKTSDDPDELRRVVTHEISHAAMVQQLGVWQHYNSMPAWFDEGLAVTLSGGGGAENVSPAEAIQALQAGRCFDPMIPGKVYGDRYGLSAHLFYRQSAMFVEHLRETSPTFVPDLVRAMQGGESFPGAFQGVMKQSIDEAWAEFKGGVGAR